MGGMKALVKTQAGPGLELMDVPMPEVGPNDVLIKIHKTAICGTDLHIWNWDKWAQQTIPVGMHVGHEFCGVIEAVGSSVTEYKPGEIVSGEGHIVCGPVSYTHLTLPQLPFRAEALVSQHKGSGGQQARLLCGVSFHSAG